MHDGVCVCVCACGGVCVCVGGGTPFSFLQISFSWVEMSIHIELHPPGLPGTGQKVCGGWVVVVGGLQ